MKVKIDDTWYDARHTPISLYLTSEDRQNIRNMQDDCECYVAFNDDEHWDEESIRNWMKRGLDRN